MAQKTNIPKSLVEQIVDDMLSSLETCEEFDAQTIQRLKRLAQQGGLSKAAQVAKAIESTQETNL